MYELSECQIPCLPRIAEGDAYFEPQPLSRRLKRSLAKPWNYTVKKNLKLILRRYAMFSARLQDRINPEARPISGTLSPGLKAGDWVRVRSKEEIRVTLDRFKELKGCAFLEYMEQYCGTTQRVLQVMERFLDERDYRVKRTRGIILLEGVICHGTPVFGRCDRCCHLFWREEWLEKLPEAVY
jgi:hypothetical protein